MKAMLSREAGEPDSLRLEDVAVPEPAAGEVRIAVRACGVNFPDVLMLRDDYQFKPPRPFAPGGEVSGVVEAAGEGVAWPAVGQRVMAAMMWGGMAEKVVCPAAKCFPLPDAMSFEEGAALLTTYGTSYHGLRQRAQLKAGETLLVLGAGGGVGLAAVELGRALKARVIAGASSREKVELAINRGAASGFVYPADIEDGPGAARALSQQIKEAVGAEGADVIYDVVGGPYAEAALRAIAWEGRFLVVGFASSIPRIPLNLALLKGCSILGVFYGAWSDRNPKARRDNVAELAALYERGEIRPHVSAAYPLARAGDAIALLAARQALGKVVVTIG